MSVECLRDVEVISHEKPQKVLCWILGIRYGPAGSYNCTAGNELESKVLGVLVSAYAEKYRPGTR